MRKKYNKHSILVRLQVVCMFPFIALLPACSDIPENDGNSKGEYMIGSFESNSIADDSPTIDNSTDGNGDGIEKENDNEPYAVDFHVSQDDEICDYFAIDSKGETVKADGYGCTSYLELKDADQLTLSMVQGSASNYGLAFYDLNKDFISFVKAPTADDIARKLVTLDIPQNAVYFRTTYFDYQNRTVYGAFGYQLMKNNETISLGKRNYQDGYIFFSREVSQTLGNTEDTSNVKVTTGVLALPKNYSATGAKTKLIIYFHGNSHYVTYGTWGNTEDFRTQKQNFLDNGYAILDCNGGRDNYGKSNNDLSNKDRYSSIGAPQYVDGFYQCYQYVVENYNIESEVYIIGASAGGSAGINFTRWHQDIVKGLLLLSPNIGFQGHYWDIGKGTYRQTFVEYLGYESTATYEAEKAALYDPMYMNKEEISVPVMLFMESNDDICNAWMNILDQEKTGAQTRYWNGYTHTQLVSGGIKDSDNAICEFFNLL